MHARVKRGIAGAAVGAAAGLLLFVFSQLGGGT